MRDEVRQRLRDLGLPGPLATELVEDVAAVRLEEFGPAHEHHPLFPERTNVQVVQVTGPDRLRMRVWERGVGVTQASGSSSCAVAVASARRGLTGRTVRVDLDGGTHYLQEDHPHTIGENLATWIKSLPAQP